MKEFNLELAKAGHPVQTRDGRKVRIICWDRKNRECYPILALVEDNDGNEMCFSYAIDGVINGGYSSKYNLVMAPEKHEGWIYIFKACDGRPCTSKVYDNPGTAESDGRCLSCDYMGTVKIEWEE